jgi:putative hemolysin
MILVSLLFLFALLFSAFYSGSETGFYRAARGRLVVDALSGDWISRGLLWLTNNPTLFVATTLVGNNVANYLLSLSLVLAAVQLLPAPGPITEIVIPLLFSPIAFVYGELLPKNLFFQAPNRLLRRAGPMLLVSTVLFAPASAILWLLGQVLQPLIGQTPLRVQLTIARQELRKMLEEGQEAGVLRPAQRMLAQNLITLGSQSVREFTRPISRALTVISGSSRADAIRLAKRTGAPVLLVRSPREHRIIGYVRTVELLVDERGDVAALHDLPIVSDDEPFAATLLHLHRQADEVVGVANRQGDVYGIIHAAELYAPLFRA